MTTKAEPIPSFPEDAALALFKAFDAHVEVETRRDPPKSDAEMRDRLRGLVDKLPQRMAIQDHHASRWLDRTIDMAHGRMELEHGEGKADFANIFSHVFWHIRRASGIGGSDASTVIKHYKGKRGTWGDAHALVKEKLLILAPQPSTEEMARGVRGEPWIQKMAHLQDKVKSDTIALDRLRGFRWDKRPASIGTPDDIIVPEGLDLASVTSSDREITDYKAPSADVIAKYDKEGMTPDYVAQLHHYATISLASGGKFEKMSIRAFDPRSFTIAKFDVPFDVNLAREIASGSHRLWHENIMMGVVPAAPKPDDLPVKDDGMIEIAIQAAMLKVMTDDLTKRGDDLRKRISAVSADWHDIATGKIDLKVGAWSRDRTWDEETLVNIAESAGVDIEPFKKPGKKAEIDSDQAIGILRELHQALLDGSNIDSFLAELRMDGLPIKRSLDLPALAGKLEEDGHSLVTAARVKEAMRLSTKKSGPEFDRLATLRDHVSQMAEAIEQVFVEKVDVVLNGETEPLDVPTDEELGM